MRTLLAAGLLALAVVGTAGPGVHAQSLFEFLFRPFGRLPDERPDDRYVPFLRPPPRAVPARPEPLPRTEPRAQPARQATQHFCVRTCDGFYFPVAADGHGEGKALCQAFCPAADTDVYRGSTAETAYNSRGRPYTALPAALRYRDGLSTDCTCRADGRPGLAALPIAQDPTLASGDVVVTEAGAQVFRGGGRGPHRDRDFVAPAKLPRDVAARLAAVERRDRPGRRARPGKPAPTDSAASEPPAPAPTDGERAVRVVGPEYPVFDHSRPKPAEPAAPDPEPAGRAELR